MSKNEKVTEDLEELEMTEKVATKYDSKVKRRKEQEEKERKENRILTIIGIVVVVAVLCVIASFPIRTYLAVNEEFVTINGEKVTKVEFDYTYNMVKNNYINQYGSYLTYFGLDITQDLSKQMYTDTLTWEDFFQQMAVESIQKNKALEDEIDAAGFEYDTTEEFENYKTYMEEMAADQGLSLNNYIKAFFGSYATMGRISEYIKQSMVIDAYYEKVSKDLTPGEDEVLSYYENNKASYDVVDYYMTIVDAQLPTGDTEEEAYEPSEAEITEAMLMAKGEASEAKAVITQDGELKEGQRKSDLNVLLDEWLFDETRKTGDATIIEDTINHRYFVLSFVQRYRKDNPSVDLRVVISTTTDGQTILDDWKKGEATEESFIELCSKYSEDTTTKDAGGLYEAVVGSDMEAVMSDWLYAPERVKGDVTAVTTSDGTHYVMYYIGQNKPEWKLNIENTLVSQAMTEYMEEIVKDVELVDSKGNLNYLKVQAQEEAAEASTENASAESAATEETASTQAAE